VLREIEATNSRHPPSRAPTLDAGTNSEHFNAMPEEAGTFELVGHALDVILDGLRIGERH
jgi:hypothetical protein